MDTNDSPSISGMQREIINNSQIGERLQKRFEEAEECERCGKRPPEVLSEFSTYVAVCKHCYGIMKEKLNESIKTQKEIDELFGY